MSRQFPNTPTFHPATAPRPPRASSPADPHGPYQRRRARGGDAHIRALRTLADPELLAAIVGGDPDALAELFARHRRELWQLAYRHVRRAHVADDVVAAVLHAVWRRADQYTGAARVSTWLYRATVNAAIDVLRREQARPETPTGAGPLATIAAVRGDGVAGGIGHVTGYGVGDGVADRDLVARLLAELPAPQRRAVELVDLAGYSVAEAAAALGCPEGTVKSRRSRALHAAAARWTPDGERRRATT